MKQSSERGLLSGVRFKTSPRLCNLRAPHEDNELPMLERSIELAIENPSELNVETYVS